MIIAALVVDIALVLALVGSAIGKLTRFEPAMTGIRSVGVPDDKVWMLAVVEFAGALGLIVGLFWAPLGIAAAVGVVLYFVGAVIGHIRAKDGQFGPAAFLCAVAVAAVVLGIATT